MAPTLGVGRRQIALLALGVSALGGMAPVGALADAIGPRPDPMREVGPGTDALMPAAFDAVLSEEKAALSEKERGLLDLVPELLAHDEYLGPTVIRCACGVYSPESGLCQRTAAVKAIVRAGFRPLLGRLWCARCFRQPARRVRFAGAWAAK